MKTKKTSNSSADEIGKHYRLNYATIVKLYHPYIQFPGNVHLFHGESQHFQCIMERCLPASLSHTGILSKWLHILKTFFTIV